MFRHASHAPGLILALVGAVLVAGCGKSPTGPPPAGIQPQIVSVQDNFSYQISNVQNYTGSATYSWQNSGTGASVNQATSVSGGAITLTLLDGAGTQVYTRTLSDNGTFPSTAGTAGKWRVRVDYAGATATVNFSAQKL